MYNVYEKGKKSKKSPERNKENWREKEKWKKKEKTEETDANQWNIVINEKTKENQERNQ